MNYKDFDLGAIQAPSSGLDSFFDDNPQIVTPVTVTPKAASAPSKTRQKVASLDQLDGFIRTASDTLVHKSNQDLWSLQKDANGDFYIERKFDNTGGPVKG